MFLEIIFRNGDVEFSQERVAILPEGVTISVILDVKNIEAAKKEIRKLLPTIKSSGDTIAEELNKI